MEQGRRVRWNGSCARLERRGRFQTLPARTGMGFRLATVLLSCVSICLGVVFHVAVFPLHRLAVGLLLTPMAVERMFAVSAFLFLLSAALWSGDDAPFTASPQRRPLLALPSGRGN